jgi:tetratricopeptide (TPR) repeat protein
MKIFIADDVAGFTDDLWEAARHMLKNGADETVEIAPNEAPVEILVASLTKSRVSGADKLPVSTPNPAVLAEAEFSADILDALGRKLLHLGQVDQAEILISAALSARIRRYGKDHPLTAESYNSRARLLRIKGDVVQAEKDVRRALSINSRVYGADSYAVVPNLTELACIQIQAGEYGGAERAAVRGLRILEQLYLEESDPNTTRLLDALARVLQVKGQYRDAIEIYQRILQQDAKESGSECSLKYATHQANFALVLLSQRSYLDAERFYRQAIEIYETKAGLPNHPDLLDIRSGYASLLAEMKKPEAVTQFRELIRLGGQLRGDKHPYVGNDHAGLARAIYELEQGNYLEDAKNEFQRALDIYKENVPERMPEDHVFIAEAKGWKARILAEQATNATADERKRLGADAEALATKALEKFQAELADDSVEIAITRAIIARALSLQGKELDRALALLQAAQPIVVAARGEQSKIARLIAAWLGELGKAKR